MATVDPTSPGLGGGISTAPFVFSSPGPVATPMFAGTITYYKMQASCSGAPSGYISWVNTSGDDAGKPACVGALGDTVEVARWSVST